MFKKIFIKLCNEHNIPPTTVCKELGLSRSSFTYWDDKTVPREATLQKIADYFDVTVEYLLGKEDVNLKQLEKGGNIREVLPQNKIRMIPLYESVSAGFGAYADDYIADYYPCYIESDTEAKETLCITVIGDSMYPKIENGDVIQVHKQDSVDNGSIAVVLIDGEEGVVKRVFYGNNWIELNSYNNMYPPRKFVGAEMLRVRVIGLVKKIIKTV